MKVGVTGIYASGKGTVCLMFRELGARVIDTDILAREVVEPGEEGHTRIVQTFGKDILLPDGSLDRKKLAGIVFSSPEKLKKLNEITHPLILKRTLETAMKFQDEIIMINTPLLFESGFHKYMDKNIVVTARFEDVIERGMLRDHLSENEIKDRVKNQFSLNEKIKLADHVIDNSGSLDNTRRQVIELWNNLTTFLPKG